ncbi:S1 RNA-binding domain-containing protein [Poriferisphaera sp. WC338]|uniref:S1 RNA-binding domain-containing protein n=1 Tax=Poriferisphaera sp. WC338 TaxID=3425129 RepID=UPI003D815B76
MDSMNQDPSQAPKPQNTSESAVPQTPPPAPGNAPAPEAPLAPGAPIAPGTAPTPPAAEAPAAPASNPQADLQKEIDDALGGQSLDDIMKADEQKEDELKAAQAESDSGTKEFHSQIKRGRIAAIRGDDVFIDLADDVKLQGVVPAAQFDRPPRLGSIMDFVVDHVDEAQGLVFLSREGAVSQANWQQLKPGMSIEARATATNKGGLELELVGNIKGFMPASQVDIHHVDDLEPFVGQKLTGLVQEIDHKGKRVVLSRRQHLEIAQKAAHDKTVSELEVGQIRKGTVSSVVDFGAFVNLGGVDGLVHVTDMAYSHVGKPSDLLKVGQEVEVKILKLDLEKDRISLGMKQIQPDPWDSVASKYKVGDNVEGTIIRTANFGAFVELEAGVEALLPMSEMSWGRVRSAEDVVKVGDKVRLAIISIDPDKHKMSLSLKAATGDPWVGAEHKYAKYNIVEGKVISTTTFGAFVELQPGIEGLVHISELSDKRVRTVEDVLKVGDTSKFRVIEIDEAEHKVKLSLKAVDKTPEQLEAESQSASPRQGNRGPDKQHAHTPSAKRKKPDNLKSGLGDVGGVGLGGLKLDDFLK